MSASLWCGSSRRRSRLSCCCHVVRVYPTPYPIPRAARPAAGLRSGRSPLHGCVVAPAPFRARDSCSPRPYHRAVAHCVPSWSRDMKVGFIGLGHMGSGMAANLLRAGHEVTVFNRSADKRRPLIDLGAREATKVADACTGEVVITMLAEDA